MAYESPRRLVTYCNEYYTKLIEAYTHMQSKRKADTGREAIVAFFRSMPESERKQLLEYHTEQNLREHFHNGEK